MSDDRKTGIHRPADLEAEFRDLAHDVKASGRVPDFSSMMERVHAEVADADVIAIGSRTPDAGTSGPRTSEDARRDFRRFGRWIPVAAAVIPPEGRRGPPPRRRAAVPIDGPWPRAYF